MDKNFYIERNKKIAMEIHGEKLGKDRRVKGTNIWYDEFWRFHID